MDEVEAVLAALWALEDSASKGNEVEARKLQGVLKRLDGCAHDLLEGALHQTFVQRDLPVPELEPRDRWSWEQRQRVRHPQTLDQLLELDWIRLGRRRMSPGRPVTFVVTPAFLDHFGLASARDLPGLADLRAAGLLDNRPLPGLGGGAGDDEAAEDPAVADDQADLFDV